MSGDAEGADMRKAAVLFAAVIVAGTPRSGRGEDPAEVNNRWMKQFVATAKPIDVLEGSSKGGYVRHADIVVDESGHGRIRAMTAVRERPWRDGIGRPSNEVRRFLDVEKQPWLLVKLSKPVAAAGGDERWEWESRTVHGDTFDVKFESAGKVLDVLPAEFTRNPACTVATMPLDRFLWVSAGALTFEKAKGYLPKSAPLFADAFSDRFGGAALVRRARDGVELQTDAQAPRGESHVVTLGYVDDPPEDDAAPFEPALYVPVTAFVEKQAKSPTLPDRLRRKVGQKNGGWTFAEGETMWMSCRYFFIYVTKAGELRFDAASNVLVADRPFTDEFGESVGQIVGKHDPSRETGGSWARPPKFTWMWPVREKPPQPEEIDAPIGGASEK
jgi:hypothetical protein